MTKVSEPRGRVGGEGQEGNGPRHACAAALSRYTSCCACTEAHACAHTPWPVFMRTAGPQLPPPAAALQAAAPCPGPGCVAAVQPPQGAPDADHGDDQRPRHPQVSAPRPLGSPAVPHACFFSGRTPLPSQRAGGRAGGRAGTGHAAACCCCCCAHWGRNGSSACPVLRPSRPTPPSVLSCIPALRRARRPDTDGTLFFGLHLHITDASGDGLLLEATPGGGWATYDTREKETGVGARPSRVQRGAQPFLPPCRGLASGPLGTAWLLLKIDACCRSCPCPRSRADQRAKLPGHASLGGGLQLLRLQQRARHRQRT